MFLTFVFLLYWAAQVSLSTSKGKSSSRWYLSGLTLTTNRSSPMSSVVSFVDFCTVIKDSCKCIKKMNWSHTRTHALTTVWQIFQLQRGDSSNVIICITNVHGHAIDSSSILSLTINNNNNNNNDDNTNYNNKWHI